MWKKYWFCLEGLVVFIVRLYRRKWEVWFYRNCKVMRLLGQTVEGLRSLRFIQLDEDVPSLISALIKLSTHYNWPRLIMQKIALSADGETCLFFFFFYSQTDLGRRNCEKGGKKREKARKPPKVITVWHVKGNSLRYWLLRLSHLRVQSE